MAGLRGAELTGTRPIRGLDDAALRDRLARFRAEQTAAARAMALPPVA